jgi:hypothetical protein
MAKIGSSGLATAPNRAERVGVFAGIASIVCGLMSLGALALTSTLVHGEGDWMIAIALIIIMVSAPAAGLLLGILALIPRRSRPVGVAGFLLSLAIATFFLVMRLAR